MELQGQNDAVTENAVRALPSDTVLSGKYQLVEMLSDDKQWITYLVKETETNSELHIKEFLPQKITERSEDGLSVRVSDVKAFSKQKKQRLTAVKKLMKSQIPHLNSPTGFFEENGTLYLVDFIYNADSLNVSDVPITAMYLRSLGIALCDTYAALHKFGFCYGNISAKELLLKSDGTYFLPYHPVLQSLSHEKDLSLDLYRLTSFLSELFLLADSEEDAQTTPSTYAVMKNVLQYRYHNAILLKNALICLENTVNKPTTFVSSRKSIVRAVLCVGFLLCGAAIVYRVGITNLPLGVCMKLGLVQPDVVSVWMPLDESADEEETLAMYKKLTAGFERKYTGYGVDLVIYAGDSFSEAMKLSEGSTELPTVFMNTKDETVFSLASDLSPLLRSLDDGYLADMDAFRNTVPLGCSLPALYYHVYSAEEIPSETMEFSDIDPAVSYDSGVSLFIDSMEEDTERTEGEFSEFLNSRSEQPFLASTAMLSIAERNGISSGAIKMLPISVNGEYPLQYEMYCTVNQQKDWNSRYIGMLWIQYLLTEEAQQIMFAENYSILPIHCKAVPQTIENHDALAVIDDILPDIDSTTMQ